MREPTAVSDIARALEEGGLSDEERCAHYTALGTIGGSEACAVLLKAFEAAKDPDLKAAIALALGQAGDPAARASLEAHVRKIFTSPKVKDACREALRRLDAPRPQAMDSSEDGTEAEDPYGIVSAADDDDDDDTQRVPAEVEEKATTEPVVMPVEPSSEDVEDPDTEEEPLTLPVGGDTTARDTTARDTAASHGVISQPVGVHEPSTEDEEDPDTEESVDTSRPAHKPAAYDHRRAEPPDLNWEATFRTTVVIRRPTGFLVAARYERRLTDASFYETTSVQVAYRSFLRDKVRQGFLPHLDRTQPILESDVLEPLDIQMLLSFWGSEGETVQASDQPAGEDRDAATARSLPPPEGGKALDSRAVMGLPSPLADGVRSTIEEDFSRLSGTSAGEDPVARLLVIDDRDFNRDLLARILRRGGHHVTVADGGAAGLERLAEGGIDLVCLDINMPGMDGYEVAEVIRRQYSRFELPIVFITARDEHADVVRGLAAGGNDYIAKPVDSAEALARVRTQLLLALALRHTNVKVEPFDNAVVLVVDDEDSNRKLLCAWLQALGHVAIEAPSGESALQVVNQQAVDVILLDLQMPGMPGQEVLSILRRYFSMVDLPILALAPADEPRIASKALLAGANDVVARPLAMDIATERLRRQLEIKALYQELRQKGEASE